MYTKIIHQAGTSMQAMHNVLYILRNLWGSADGFRYRAFLSKFPPPGQVHLTTCASSQDTTIVLEFLNTYCDGQPSSPPLVLLF